MDELKQLIQSFLGIALIVAVSFLLGCRYGRRTATVDPGSRVVRDTVTYTVHDTITRERPVYRYSYVHDTVKAYFTTIKHDTVTVDLPIERKVYQEDSLYRAVVSGPRCGKYGPSLDSLVVYPTITTITIREKEREKRGKIGVGATLGPGIIATPKGTLHAGIGVTAGVSYKF